ncbi:hypothetical protein FGJ01_00055 [Hydrogenophaga intermedia]|nr:hypothetical protein FGJ01_00055 [Hydrogenophaga intermedia]
MASPQRPSPNGGCCDRGGFGPLFAASDADDLRPCGPARSACLSVPSLEVGMGGLAVPFTVSRRSRRQGRRAPCALASWRPSSTL